MRTYLALLVCAATVTGPACRRAPTDDRKTTPAAPRSIQDAKAPVTTPAARGKQITLVYSSNGDGDYEQCGCPVHPLGGVTRRATVIDRARADADAALVLDAGDLFLPRRGNDAGGKRPDAGEIER